MDNAVQVFPLAVVHEERQSPCRRVPFNIVVDTSYVRAFFYDGHILVLGQSKLGVGSLHSLAIDNLGLLNQAVQNTNIW